jgi:hypothetical protein
LFLTRLLKAAKGEEPHSIYGRLLIKMIASWALVDHTYDPSYLGDRDQKDCDSWLAQANSSGYPILKIPNTKKGLT